VGTRTELARPREASSHSSEKRTVSVERLIPRSAAGRRYWMISRVRGGGTFYAAETATHCREQARPDEFEMRSIA